jgi:hypothetical protein
MLATLAQLQARLDALKAALANGVTAVEHGDTRVQYRSIAEIRAAIGVVEQNIATAGGAGIIRSFKFTTSKGL